ncbi:tectonin domain-containing protein [Candidatus Riflebacteria bacterium]
MNRYLIFLLFFFSALAVSGDCIRKGYSIKTITNYSHLKKWWDKGSGGRFDVSVWQPSVPRSPHGDFNQYGDFAWGYYRSPNGHPSPRPIDSAGYIGKSPVSFKLLWHYPGKKEGIRTKCWPSYVYWPVPPKGYVTMGAIVESRVIKPKYISKNRKIVGATYQVYPPFNCLKRSLVVEGKLGPRIWCDRGSGAKQNVSFWLIVPKDENGIGMNCFYAANQWHKPTNVKVYVLKRAAFSYVDGWFTGFDKGWKKLPGTGIDIAVGSGGHAWYLDMKGSPHKLVGKIWRRYPGNFVRIAVDRSGRAWVIDKRRKIFVWNVATNRWKKIPGDGTDIGCGGPGIGVTWLIGGAPEGGGFGIFRRKGGTWEKIPGSGMKIAVDRSGMAWMVNNVGRIHRYTSRGWQLLPGHGLDIGAGPNGKVWLKGLDKTLFSWNGKNWIRKNGTANHITVDERGLPWVIGQRNGIWTKADLKNRDAWIKKNIKPITQKRIMIGHPPSGNWAKLPGAGMDIGVGKNGVAWCVGLNYAPFKWDGRTWRQYPGGIVRVDVDNIGRPWAINGAKNIFVMDVHRKVWHLLPGRAKDIGCGGPGNGVTCIIGTNKRTYKWDGRKWLDLGGGAKRVDVDKDGNPWVVNDAGDIWWHEVKRRRWHRIPTGKAIDIACGPDGTIWILDRKYWVCKWDGKTFVRGNGQGYQITVDHRGLPWLIGMDKGFWYRTK